MRRLPGTGVASGVAVGKGVRFVPDAGVVPDADVVPGANVVPGAGVSPESVCAADAPGASLASAFPLCPGSSVLRGAFVTYTMFSLLCMCPLPDPQASGVNAVKAASIHTRIVIRRLFFIGSFSFPEFVPVGIAVFSRSADKKRCRKRHLI